MSGAAPESATPARPEAPQRAPLVQREPLTHTPPARREAPAEDSDSDGVELFIPPLPSPPSLVVGWRILRLVRAETAAGRAVVEINGQVEAALEPADEHGFRFRVRFDSGSELDVDWLELHPWLRYPTPAAGTGQQPAAAHAAAPAPAAGVGGRPPAQYKGVSADCNRPGMFRMVQYVGDRKIWTQGLRSAEAAARAYDEGRRRLGKRVVKFPRAGTDEVQAVPYEAEQTTLRRADGDAGQPAAPVQRAPRPKAAKEPAVETVVHTPMALRRAPAAASPSPSHAGPLIGRHVRSTFSEDGYCTVWHGVVEAKRNGKYLVRYKDDSTYEMTKDEVKKYNVPPPGAGCDALDELKTASARKRSRDDLARTRAAAGAAPKRQRAAAPAASSSCDDDSAAAASESESEPVETPPPVPAAAPPAAAAPSGGVDDVEAFLRGIKPPLSDLNAALAALRASRVTVAHLALARQEPEERGELMEWLHITDVADRMAFTSALRKAKLPPSDA